MHCATRRRDQLDLFDDAVDTSVDVAVHDAPRAVYDGATPVHVDADDVHDVVDDGAHAVDDIAVQRGATDTNDDARGLENAGEKFSAPLAIELRKGTKRRRNVEGVLHGDTLVVSYPPRIGQAGGDGDRTRAAGAHGASNRR